MLSSDALHEFRSDWLPNISDGGIDRLIDLLEKASPFLISGCFTRTIPMGCLASHIAWNHPECEHLTIDAGICWLHHVAGLNPATSRVLLEWDRRGAHDLDLRQSLREELLIEKQRRSALGDSVTTPELAAI